MTLFWVKMVWAIGVVGWFVIRYPHARRSKRTTILRRSDRLRERILLSISLTGLGILPAVYVFVGFHGVADYSFQPWAAWLGTAVFACSLWLFDRTHKDLGRNWSVTLEVREQHRLITRGVYHHIRHPMYSALVLYSLGQALVIPNWVAGPANLVAFTILFTLRVHAEEQMMSDTFGDEYAIYAARTKRLVPGVW